MAEWDWEENNKLGLDPNKITSGSHTRAFWKCKNGHSWGSECSNRVAGYGCPICSNKKVLVGYNDLLTIQPELCKEWNHEKNSLKPTECTQFSHKKVWWKCQHEHEWESEIASRTSGQGCPYCAGQKVWIGFNDLATTHPTLCKEWNYSKNEHLKPSEVSKGTTKKVWWICEDGHEWQASPNSRVSGNNCPYCSNKKILVGYNDLTTTHPNLCKEWDYEKNTNIAPTEVSKGSETMIWWICDVGHSWKASVYERTHNRGCPQCQKESQSSFPEKCIFFYASKYFDVVLENYRPNYLGKMEFDIFIPNLNIAVEYDGANWHKNLDRDIKKNLLCEQNKIKLFRIRESGCPLDNNNYDYVIYINLDDYNNDLKLVIEHLLKMLSITDYDIDIVRDNVKIMNLLVSSRKENSIIDDEKLLHSWNYEKNEGLNPEYIKLKSNKKVWWKCSLGHEWQATPYSRISGNDCPYCSNHKILIGFNDLSTTHSSIAKQWDYQKNINITPQMVSFGSNKKVWWICEIGHSYLATIAKRVSGTGCPVCSKRRRTQTAKRNYFKQNPPLSVSHPELCLEWDNEKNHPICPSEVSFGSQILVWWKCSLGHEWQAKICNRVRGDGCPVCKGKKIVTGVNDLFTLEPQLQNEWDFSKNKIDPKNTGCSSREKVWWKCPICNHEWQTQIHSRTGKKKTGCPKCARKTKK